MGSSQRPRSLVRTQARTLTKTMTPNRDGSLIFNHGCENCTIVRELFDQNETS